MTTLHTRLRFVVAVCALVVIVACDSIDKAAKKIMADQGLTLVEPARDYIALGGIVSLSHGGRPLYEDPYDTLPNDNGTYSSFNAVISQNTRNQSIGIDAAVGSLGNIVTLPASISGAVNHSSSVKLSQVDTGGIRYTTQKIAALLTRQATRDAIRADLNAGLRVFLIQEVYTATSFSIASSNSTSIAAAAGGSPPSPQCTTDNSGSTGSAGTVSGTSSETRDAAGTSGSSTTSTAGTPSSSGSRNTASSSGSGSGSSASSGSGKSGSATSATSGSQPAPMSLGFCWNGNSSLSFKTERPIPFAVRLNEVESGPGGILQIKKTNFKLPLNTLGGDNVQGTATIPSGKLASIERKPKS